MVRQDEKARVYVVYSSVRFYVSQGRRLDAEFGFNLSAQPKSSFMDRGESFVRAKSPVVSGNGERIRLAFAECRQIDSRTQKVYSERAQPCFSAGVQGLFFAPVRKMG